MSGAGSKARADWVLDWNMAALEASRVSGELGPQTSRNLATLHTAIYDAINALDGGFTMYHATGVAPSGADQRAAVAAAAKKVMDQLYPTMTSSFASLYADQMATIGESQSKTEGINWGTSVGTEIYDWRHGDSSNNAASTPYSPGISGNWGGTPNHYAPWNYLNTPLLPGWGNVTPFAMSINYQFRPAGSPSLTSAQYAADYNEVFAKGALVGSSRLADETTQAYYWADLPGQTNQVGHWNNIAGHLLGGEHGADLRTEARVMAALNVALADANIAAWDAKYVTNMGTAFNTWRPISAIANGENDGNALTAGDDFAGTPAGWNSLIDAPPTPEYISDIATVSGAAGAILKHYFGDIAFNYQGDSDGDGTWDTLRSFGSITDAVNEAAIAGVYAGTDFRTASLDGSAVGTNVGNWTVSNYFLEIAPVPEPSSLLLLLGAAAVSLRRRRRKVQA